MIPTDEELDKVFKLFREYTREDMPTQQKFSMFDYIKNKWNDGI